MNVYEVYQDTDDKINHAENGYLSFARFNRFAWLGQLRLMDWISGDISGLVPPEPYLSQKNKDWLAPFITKLPVQVTNGIITKPPNYYMYENMYRLGNMIDADCEEETEDTGVVCNKIIELLDGAKYNARCETYIEGLEPSFKKPISKLVGSEFEFNPSDLGSITLEYIRYPVKARIGTKIDTVFNDEVYDPSTSVDFEWEEKARDVLIWFIAEMFSLYTREKALFEHNKIMGKTVRG